ncbi:hypothetical protein O7606_18895 [Micromonospora sp. WMMD882]|uniref:FtsB family cell division protein n=1 Tax=Micromonospora sp. WMMD882 TaxID=3015151 RepID=UPI00248B1E5E|nr:hypothetical protein [Micromonospora sp. WMMD882]WBB78288.1 hypothetical protein O7606_18895 [Micromonospora sp. WMMD882]
MTTDNDAAPGFRGRTRRRLVPRAELAAALRSRYGSAAVADYALAVRDVIENCPGIGAVDTWSRLAGRVCRNRSAHDRDRYRKRFSRHFTVETEGPPWQTVVLVVRHALPREERDAALARFAELYEAARGERPPTGERPANRTDAPDPTTAVSPATISPATIGPATISPATGGTASAGTSAGVSAAAGAGVSAGTGAGVSAGVPSAGGGREQRDPERLPGLVTALRRQLVASQARNDQLQQEISRLRAEIARLRSGRYVPGRRQTEEPGRSDGHPGQPRGTRNARQLPYDQPGIDESPNSRRQPARPGPDAPARSGAANILEAANIVDAVAVDGVVVDRPGPGRVTWLVDDSHWPDAHRQDGGTPGPAGRRRQAPAEPWRPAT